MCSNHGHEHVAAFEQSIEQALRVSRLERGRPKRLGGAPSRSANKVRLLFEMGTMAPRPTASAKRK